MTLHLHRKRNTSSLYETDDRRVSHFQDAARLATEEKHTLKTRSLDEVCADLGIAGIDYLKVDIEGHELAALEGYHGPMLICEVEVSFYPFRRGIPLADEVLSHMRRRGMFLLDLRRSYWTPSTCYTLRNYPEKGMLIFGDALFAADPFLADNATLFSTHAARAKYLALFCAYGYAAEALMMIDVFAERGLVADEEAAESKALIHRLTSSWKIPRLRIARLLLAIERWVHLPVAVGAGLSLSMNAQTDGELGNWTSGRRD